MLDTKGMKVTSSIGELYIDTAGSPVAAAKMATDKAYTGIPVLLQKYINDGDTQAWNEIKEKIDYIYTHLGRAMDALDQEADLGSKMGPHMKAGKKLLFKPNLVSPVSIDPVSHGEAGANGACTQWPFVAALMRWFHDKLEIHYSQMSVGEAGTGFPGTAVSWGQAFNNGTPVTTESIFEGRRGDFYGGWGFYFVRQYLADTHPDSHDDNPMNGYEESVSGEYIPPGKAGNRMMVYDLNRVKDIPSKARDISVPDAAMFEEITLHKAIIGGNPDDPGDLADYPGCVLVNVPRLKPHIHEPLTNSTKNLGVGLYPMEATVDDDPDSTQWKYSVPKKYPPSQKAGLPHEVWRPTIDDATGLPARDENGEYIVTKTTGLKGTIMDVVKATEAQDVMMIHVVSAIQPMGWVEKDPEGFAFVSLDTVALDNLCYRHTCKSVPVATAKKLQKEYGLKTDFIQKVKVPKVAGDDIITAEGYDTPITRSNLISYAEERGLGQQDYYVVGWDGIAEAPLVSLQGHLGRTEGEEFTEVFTTELGHHGRVMLWGLQETTLGYFRANDKLTGSSYLKELLDALDETGDGILGYEETGKKGYEQMFERWLGEASYLRVTDKFGGLKGSFNISAKSLRYANAEWNAEGHHFCKEARLANAAALAFGMSRAQTEQKDPLFPTMTWGKGKWPSVQHALSASAINAIYGAGATGSVSPFSVYGCAFQYADKALNDSGYTGSGSRDAVSTYMKAVSEGASPLDFMLYVPEGFGTFNGKSLPNVAESDDPSKILRASFSNGNEWW